jgi:S-adenosylmethionine:tRNA ribosyltransferase-isomerase
MIAQYPAEERDGSRMMVVDRGSGTISHRQFRDLPEFLGPADVVVINETSVIRARLLGRKADSDIEAEVMLLREVEQNVWECLVRPGRRLPVGSRVVFDSGIECELVSRTEFGGRVARFEVEGDVLDFLRDIGHIPLPPYIRRSDEKEFDGERYQTVYARARGSVAAPTAGLHFTRQMMETLRAKGVRIAPLVLHIGLGTFRPVKVQEVEEHEMHREAYSVPDETAAAINGARKDGRRVLTVGTSATRALETAAGDDGAVRPGPGKSGLFIYPGYEFRVVETLLTNFHLPRSTLLMMVSAFAGRELILEAYREAVKEGYRFYSYGDCMLIV